MIHLFPEETQAELASISDEFARRFSARFNSSEGPGQFTIYDAYPYLFRSAFPQVEREALKRLALAGRFFASGSILFDKAMDGNPHRPGANILRGQLAMAEGFGTLVEIFPGDSAFWPRFRDLFHEFTSACEDELGFSERRTPWSAFTLDRALQIAVGKTALAQATVHGLDCLSGMEERRVERLLDSVRNYYIGRQIWDDVCDWKEDLRAGTPSLLLARLLPEGPSAPPAAEDLPSLARRIYYEGHLQEVLAIAVEHLDQALASCEPWPDLPWRQVILKVRQDCTTLDADVSRIAHDNLARLDHRPPMPALPSAGTSPWSSLALDSLNQILREWRQGFGELRHLMHLGTREGFSSDREYHHGDVFQRALVADALCDARDHLPEVPPGTLDQVLLEETDYLLSAREKDPPGGWKYFPSLPELAPDADDLAQVMQALLRSGRQKDVRRHAESSLSTLLEDRALPDGSFETWVVPSPPKTPIQQRQAYFNESRWGVGPDTEVVANLLLAIRLYDPDRFQERIRRGIGFLMGKQEPDGSWRSRWYAGPFYGTYLVLRLMTLASPAAPEVEQAKQFIRMSQRGDGGWGNLSASTPLSTALALLCLASGPIPAEDFRRAEAALVYLRNVRQGDGTWPASPFILPRMGEHFASQTLTHAYLLKAGAAWSLASSSHLELAAPVRIHG